MINPLGVEVEAPRLSWEILSDAPSCHQSAYELRMAGSEKEVQRGRSLWWSSGKVAGSQSNQIPYSGPELSSGQRVYWQVRIWDNQGNRTGWSHPAWWEMGILSPDGWLGKWIEPTFQTQTTPPLASPYLRREFNVRKSVASARLYITAHGLYLAELDGRKVSPDHFTPGWTSYNKRLQYQVYDITDQLTPGRHALGVILGEGWYLGAFSWDNKHNIYGNKLGLLAQLVLRYSDGTQETVTSNDTWKFSAGPILRSEIYHGELYDARLEMYGWSKPGFDDRHWSVVSEAEYPLDILTASCAPPVRCINELTPVNIFTAPNGDTVVDMGQNMVGWVRLKVQGSSGTKVTLHHAEVLDQQVNIYTDNLRTARQRIEYILRGGEEEVYEPHFTFQGFRYIAVSGYPGILTTESLTGMVLHSDMEPSGSFECSDSLLNQLQHNIVWGLKGNFLDVPTDCPQRDERMGWTGDAQVFAPTACFNMNAASFYTKWLRDVAADQHENGMVPHVIPDVIGGGAATGWADVAVILPWTLYCTYGDTRILSEQYPSMKSWVEYMRTQAGETYIWNRGSHFGDWLAFATNRSDYPGATTDKDFLATAYYAYSTTLLAKIAAIVGENADAQDYTLLAQRIKQALLKEFMTPGGRLSPNTQTAYVLALSFDLIPEEMVSQMALRLADDVRKFGHITTGFLGTSGINPVLSQNGFWDEAYLLLKRLEYPSWLYPVTKGATTIWERWDGIKPDGTFQDQGMNSFNHYAYGAIGNWMYQNIGGIQPDPDVPGYQRFLIKPHPGGGITWARTSYKSLFGEITCHWKIAETGWKMQVTIPANTSAEIFFPNGEQPEIREFGSGTYHFEGR